MVTAPSGASGAIIGSRKYPSVAGHRARSHGAGGGEVGAEVVQRTLEDVAVDTKQAGQPAAVGPLPPVVRVVVGVLDEEWSRPRPGPPTACTRRCPRRCRSSACPGAAGQALAAALVVTEQRLEIRRTVAGVAAEPHAEDEQPVEPGLRLLAGEVDAESHADLDGLFEVHGPRHRGRDREVALVIGDRPSAGSCPGSGPTCSSAGIRAPTMGSVWCRGRSRRHESLWEQPRGGRSRPWQLGCGQVRGQVEEGDTDGHALGARSGGVGKFTGTSPVRTSAARAAPSAVSRACPASAAASAVACQAALQ